YCFAPPKPEPVLGHHHDELVTPASEGSAPFRDEERPEWVHDVLVPALLALLPLGCDPAPLGFGGGWVTGDDARGNGVDEECVEGAGDAVSGAGGVGPVESLLPPVDLVVGVGDVADEPVAPGAEDVVFQH